MKGYIAIAKDDIKVFTNHTIFALIEGIEYSFWGKEVTQQVYYTKTLSAWKKEFDERWEIIEMDIDTMEGMTKEKIKQLISVEYFL